MIDINKFKDNTLEIVELLKIIDDKLQDALADLYNDGGVGNGRLGNQGAEESKGHNARDC